MEASNKKQNRALHKNKQKKSREFLPVLLIFQTIYQRNLSFSVGAAASSD